METSESRSLGTSLSLLLGIPASDASAAAGRVGACVGVPFFPFLTLDCLFKRVCRTELGWFPAVAPVPGLA